ncbi:MAG: hypothetical protein ACK5Q5_01935 [Planctomycetaceae bacterium]
MTRILRSLLLCTALIGSVATPVSACPLCKAANESDQNGEPNTKPQAYMYSILFMLAMPATLLGAFSFAFWRLSKQAAANVDPTLDETI